MVRPMGTLNSDIAAEFLGGSTSPISASVPAQASLTNAHRVRNINVTATLEGQAPEIAAPVAVADTATTAAGTSVNIAVLANDSDPDSDPLTVTAVSNVVGGTATIQRRQHGHLHPHRGLQRSRRLHLHDLRRNDDEFGAGQRDGHRAPSAVALTPHCSASLADRCVHLDVGGEPGRYGDVAGRIDVRQDFTAAFEVNLGASDGGADGVAVVFHNDARGADAVGVHGTGLGVGGIDNGLAIEFDTYNSSAVNLSESSMPGVDIASDHTGFLGTDSAFASTPVALPNIEDGGWHAVVVTWNAATQTMSYTFDGQSIGTLLTVISLRSSSAARTSPISVSVPAQGH